MRQQAEGIGITLKMRNIVPECRGNRCFQFLAGSFCKECLDSFFARMTKGWIAQVVSQAGRRDYLPDLFEHGVA